MTTQMTLDKFQIGIIGPNETYTDQVYANGNQQISVFIYISKQVFDPNTGTWTQTPLSQAEKNSLSVREYASSLDAPLPAGWACDTTKNQFDQGLRGASRSGEASPEGGAGGGTRAWESFTLYLRAGTSVTPVQNYQFMARVQLDDGKVYTTHFSEGSTSFESKITVSPQRPYVIQVGELAAQREDPYAYEYDKGKWVDVDVYYWTLPSSLRLISEAFSGQGYTSSKLLYAYERDEDKLYMGAAIKFTVTSLTLGDIGHVPGNVSTSTEIKIITSDTMMRAMRYLADGMSGGGGYNNNMSWTITDNLGCVSRFVLRSNNDDKGNTLVLIQG